MLKTLIIGATTNPERMAFKAAQRLKKNGHEVVLIGNKSGEIDGNPNRRLDFPAAYLF